VHGVEDILTGWCVQPAQQSSATHADVAQGMQQSKYESGFGVVSLQRLIERDIVKKVTGKRTTDILNHVRLVLREKSRSPRASE